VFPKADCIVVVDKQAQPSLHLDYAVLTDDTAPEADHISLSDSKTHQFFALAGTLLTRATDHAFLSWDDSSGVAKTMPTWLSAADVTRAAQGVTAEDMTAFAADQVEARDLLETDPALARALRPLVGGTRRVPITAAQATAGVDWDLGDVPPGVYQIAAYIFSPPYNGWAVRPGVIKVIDGADGAQAHAAVTLEPVAARVFTGQGRRLRGCVDAVDGARLQVSTRPRAELPGAFELSVMQEVGNGPFELCLANEGVDGVLEIRLEVHAAAGMLAATQSADALTFFSTNAACKDSDLVCCAQGSVADASVPAGDPNTPASPPMPTTPGRPVSLAGAGAAGEAASTPSRDPASDPSDGAPKPESGRASAPSCQCQLGSSRAHGTFGVGIALLASRLRRRRHRPLRPVSGCSSARAAS
jgi:hypothetical protein